MLTLDLALITHRPEGIHRVASMNLPYIDGVRYIVSWQLHENAPVPAALLRDDVEIHRFEPAGQSLNRNNAIDHCTADIVLNSDDDLIYTSEGLRQVIRAFEDNPETDVATFKAVMFEGPVYPAESRRLAEPLPKGYWIPCITIAFRRNAVGNLRFHPEFGLGSERLHGAEDELFLLSAIRRGLDCRYFPIEICAHPQESTGTKSRLTPSNMRAMGCYIAIAEPLSAVLRLPLKAYRLQRSGRSGFFRALYHLIAGAANAPRILRGDRQCLW